MDLSNAQRVALLTKTLISKPGDIPRYFAHAAALGNTPLGLALPWFSYRAIDFLEHFLQPEMSVFEWGTGGSTLFFASRCQSVLSIEDDEQWLALVCDRIAKEQITNAEIRHLPFDFKNPQGFAESAYVNAIGDQQFDLIVVDGQDWTRNERPVCFQRAQSNIKPGGIILVDDSWRYQDLRHATTAKKVETFQGVGPCRVGVTSTDVYFY
jgi:hypothetical protein